MLEIKSIGVEFGDARGGDDDSRWVVGLDDVQGKADSIAKYLGDVSSGRRLGVSQMHTLVSRLSGGLENVSR